MPLLAVIVLTFRFEIYMQIANQWEEHKQNIPNYTSHVKQLKLPELNRKLCVYVGSHCSK